MVYVKHVDIHILAQSFIKKKTVNKKLNVVIFLLLKKKNRTCVLQKNKKFMIIHN